MLFPSIIYINIYINIYIYYIYIIYIIYISQIYILYISQIYIYYIIYTCIYIYISYYIYYHGDPTCTVDYSGTQAPHELRSSGSNLVYLILGNPGPVITCAGLARDPNPRSWATTFEGNIVFFRFYHIVIVPRFQDCIILSILGTQTVVAIGLFGENCLPTENP